MKKFLFSVLAIIMLLSGCAGNTKETPGENSKSDTPAAENSIKESETSASDNNSQTDIELDKSQVRINGWETLDALRALLSEEDDDALEAFILDNVEGSAMFSRSYVKRFFKTIDDLPFPVIPDAEMSIIYHSGGIELVDIYYTEQSGGRYMFRYSSVLANTDIEKHVENQTGKPAVLLFEKDERIKVYALTAPQDPSENEVVFYLVIDDIFFNPRYENAAIKEITKVAAEDIYKELTVKD